MAFNANKYYHKDYLHITEVLVSVMPCYESYEKYYKEFTEKMRKPDLFGKTVRVTAKQFPGIYSIVCNLAESLDMSVPDVFVYENYYYEFESFGVEKPWIEISASAVADMSRNELAYFLAREMFKIKTGITKQYMVAEEFVKFLEKHSSIVMFSADMIKTFELKYAQWSRSAQYSADNYAYTYISDIALSARCVLLSILNNKFLVDHMDIKEYLSDCDIIDSFSDPISLYTKSDEKTPYGQYRIKNLLKFAALDANREE